MDLASDDQAKAVIAEVFGRAAASYGQGSAGYFGTFGQRLVEHVRLGSGMAVLDVGTGRGAILFPPSFGEPPLHTAAAFDQADKVAAAVNQAGYQPVQVLKETTTFAYPSPEEWWSVRWSYFGRLPWRTYQARP